MPMTKGEMVVSKAFSAQWLMSVVVTVFASAITFFVVWKRPEHVNLVIPVFFTQWGIIITNYFRRDRTQDNTNTTTTEVKTEVSKP